VTADSHPDTAIDVRNHDFTAGPDDVSVAGPVFLTRMELNRARAGTRRLLTSPQSLHACLVRALPLREPFRMIHDPFAALGCDDTDTVLPRAEPPASGHDLGRSGARLLWRVDRDGPRATLYMLSSCEPDLTHFIQQAGGSTGGEPGWRSLSCNPLLEGLRQGQRWGFRLVANVSRAENEGREENRRISLGDTSDRARWLVERTPSLGISLTGSSDSGSVVDLVIDDPRTVRFHRDGKQITLATVRFGGTLEVQDPALLRRALVDGIGRGRAYGCGLLTLMPTA